MLITRETDYALRVLRALSEGEQLTAGDISEQQMVPKPFAYKIIKKLSKAGFVRITRGADGGCRLAVGLDKVTLYDLMAAMEEDVQSSPAWSRAIPALGGKPTEAAWFTAGWGLYSKGCMRSCGDIRSRS